MQMFANPKKKVYPKWGASQGAFSCTCIQTPRPNWTKVSGFAGSFGQIKMELPPMGASPGRGHLKANLGKKDPSESSGPN